MPYWACLLLIPAAWVGVFTRTLPHIDWGRGADPDNDVYFAIVASLFLGTPIGLLGAVVFMLGIVLIAYIRG